MLCWVNFLCIVPWELFFCTGMKHRHPWPTFVTRTDCVFPGLRRHRNSRNFHSSTLSLSLSSSLSLSLSPVGVLARFSPRGKISQPRGKRVASPLAEGRSTELVPWNRGRIRQEKRRDSNPKEKFELEGNSLGDASRDFPLLNSHGSMSFLYHGGTTEFGSATHTARIYREGHLRFSWLWCKVGTVELQSATKRKGQNIAQYFCF